MRAAQKPRAFIRLRSPAGDRSVSVLLAGLISAAPFFNGATRSEEIYKFDERANALLEVFFPTRMTPTMVLRPYQWRHDPPALPDLDAVMLLSQHAELPAFVELPELKIAADHLDSYWLSMTQHNGRAETLLSLLQKGQTEGLIRSLADSNPRFGSALEKALFQRDLFQIYGILERAIRLAQQPFLSVYGESLLREVARLWPRTTLSPEEFKALGGTLPARIDRRRFCSEHGFDLGRDYLPDRVVAQEQGWYSLPLFQEQIQHFLVHEGRSFFHIFIKTPGLNETEFQEYWRRADEALGERMTLSGRVDPLPPGTETLLVRTFGVFLTDGAYADSRFPEEILLRIFKYDAPNLDKSTSDYRGTLAYQYKMQRGSLLADSSSLGLRRIRDDDHSFPGFFTEVPDPSHTQFGDPLSTMRFNCIVCHSTVRYGAGTVFSLSVEPDSALPSYLERPWLSRTGNGRFYTLETVAAQSLRQAVTAINAGGSPK